MIGHQHIGMHGTSVFASRLGHIEKKSVVIVFPKEHCLPIIAALSDMQWLARDNQPWRTRYMGIFPPNNQ